LIGHTSDFTSISAFSLTSESFYKKSAPAFIFHTNGLKKKTVVLRKKQTSWGFLLAYQYHLRMYLPSLEAYLYHLRPFQN